MAETIQKVSRNIWNRPVYRYRGFSITQHHSWRVGGWCGADTSIMPEVYVTPTGVAGKPHYFSRRRDLVSAIDRLSAGRTT